MANYLAVLGGNALACPAIEHLNRVGFKTLVLDANPSSPARECSTRFVITDFSIVRSLFYRLVFKRPRPFLSIISAILAS